MQKPLFFSSVLVLLLGTNLNAKSIYERFEAMEKEMQKLKEEITALKAAAAAATDKKESFEEEEYIPTAEERLFDIEESIAELNRNTSGSHLKFQVDYRFAIENIDYKTASGKREKNDAFMTNRLWLNMGYQATNNLSFNAQLAYNKAFGARSGISDPSNTSFEVFDWIANENAYDDSLRIRSAYFFYKDMDFFGLDVPWTFSIGRRPSTNGHLVNFRDDDRPSSALGHSINVEFDGLSSKFTLYPKYGTYVKFCAGRGMSNAAPKFSNTPYADVDNTGANSNIDLVGLIFSPYDTRRYSLLTQYYYADNLIDVKNTSNYQNGFNTVGGIHSATLSFLANGIGNGWSEFLDYSKIFASFALSITDPKEGEGMLGSDAGESKTGTSFWIGTQFPSLISHYGKWGIEYNHGSRYWRSITYGEDTNIGSKLAARGDAYEVYMTEYLVEDILSLQLRYTYIDYKYGGSNGFFGNTSGAALSMSEATATGIGDRIIDKAQDIRLYLRYKY